MAPTDPDKTKDQPSSELAQLRQRIAELEASESRQQTAESLRALGAAVGLSLTHTDSLARALQQ